MRNLSRTLALSAALVLTALTIPAVASPLGNCAVRCVNPIAPGYTTSTTKADCCSGNYTNHCPAGSTPVTTSWNGQRCTV
jgi:hypothetical protein